MKKFSWQEYPYINIYNSYIRVSANKKARIDFNQASLTRRPARERREPRSDTMIQNNMFYIATAYDSDRPCATSNCQSS